MKEILRLSKKSAKKIFEELRKNQPYYSSELKENIFVWRSFFEHITKKPRWDYELTKRFIIFPFLIDIIKNWKKTEIRYDKKWNIYFKISINDWDDVFSIILYKNKKSTNLLSCFIENKKNLS